MDATKSQHQISGVVQGGIKQPKMVGVFKTCESEPDSFPACLSAALNRSSNLPCFCFYYLSD